MTVSRTQGNKAQAACALRMSGADYQEIADALGYADVRSVKSAINNVLASTATERDKMEHRTLANARLTQLLRTVWSKATNPDDPEQLVASREARALVHEMVTLNGAAAPSELIVSTPTTTQIAEWVAKVGAANAPDVIEADVFEVFELEAGHEDQARDEVR